ncbi:unnamed protein product [Diamesa serratosioi]
MSKARIITVVSAISFIIILTAVLIHLFMVVEVPEKCHFYNTINITGSHQFENGSHVFENDIFHKEFIKEFDYIMINGTEQIPVEPHLRGCVCEFKTCIRTCKSMNNITIFNVQNEEENVVLDNNNYYGLVGNPCKDSYVTDADDGDTWHFLPNGSILVKGHGIMGTEHFCFSNYTNDDSKTVVHVCSDLTVDVDKDKVNITMSISFPFLLVTFLIYGWIPQLRNVHGKSLMSYVGSLIFLFVFLISVQLDKKMISGTMYCKLSGHISYFCAISCFFWLNVMCYDIWSTFKTMMSVLLGILIVTVLLVSNSQYVSSYYFNDLKGPCDFIDTINITSGHKDRHGNYIYNGDTFHKGLFAEYNYVVENFTEKLPVQPHIRGCLCSLKPCIRLCCTTDKNDPNYQSDANHCIDEETITVPYEDGDDLEIRLNGGNYGVMIGKPCVKMYKAEPEEYPDDSWHLIKNGSVLFGAIGSVVDPNSYCFGKTTNDTNVTAELLMCFYEKTDVRYALYPIGMLFSLPFLLLTLFVYGFIPELRNLHGKSLMCYVFGLSVLYIFLSFVQLHIDQPVESTSCIVAAYMIYVSVLLCFFWLNVMCYDIWSTFRGAMRGRGGNAERKRFINYCLYAFGVPLLFTCTLAFMDNSGWVGKAYRPQMGIERCWMKNSRWIEFFYIYLPISIILCTNITLYSITAYRIYKVQQETSVVRKGDSQRHSNINADKDRFFLYLRLFIVMGATWSMESVSWLFESSYVVFYISDILNCLQGFIIFMLFVWKPKVKSLILKRIRSIRKLPPTASSTQNSAGSMRTESSRISSGVSSKSQGDKLMMIGDS